MKLFMIAMMAAIAGANYYVLLRLWQLIPPGNTAAKIIVVAGGIAAASSFFLYFFIRNHAPEWLLSAIYAVGTSWFFILLYLLLIFLVADIVCATGLVPGMKGIMKGNWTTLGILAGTMFVIFVSGYLVYLKKERVELSITLDKAEGAAPFRIVAVSDMHLGYGIGPRELGKWVELINAENPDAILIAGDMIDTDTRPLYSRDMARILNSFRAKYGVFLAPGNHEYISGFGSSMDFIEKTNITMLKDSAVLLAGEYYIAGRDDRSNPDRKTIPELLAPLDRTKPLIMLDHQPYDLNQVEKNGVDLQISGHTHRGQVWPISWITDAMYEKSAGYLRKGDSHIYVSSGIGVWGGKFRIGTRSEYVVINIGAAKR